MLDGQRKIEIIVKDRSFVCIVQIFDLSLQSKKIIVWQRLILQKNILKR